jgi:hypothetical protein
MNYAKRADNITLYTIFGDSGEITCKLDNTVLINNVFLLILVIENL